MSPPLRVLDITPGHSLGFALELRDHFTGLLVEEELRVSAALGRLRPTLGSDGSRRASDGTYRFVDLPAGTYAVEYAAPSGRYASWDPPLAVGVPLADARVTVKRDLWPTASAPVPLGMTALRGKLLGSRTRGVKVHIQRTGAALDRYTMSDPDGELLFVLPTPLPLVAGRIELTATLDGGALTVSGIDVIRAGATLHFGGPDFTLLPGVESRVKFHVA
jgi:hypothetical protein